jgi:periplasmic copper chaperone A
MRHPAHLIVTLLLVLCVGGAARAQTSAASTIVVEQPFARATPKGAMTGAAYMTLLNNGASAERLVGATTPVADKVQFHQASEENGVSRMREVPSVDLEPGAKVSFKPGDMHMMIVGLKQPLVQGQTLSLALQFEKAGNVEVTVPIQGIGAMQHDNNMGPMTHGPDGPMKK